MWPHSVIFVENAEVINTFEHCYKHTSPGILNQDIGAISNIKKGVFYFDDFTWLLLFLFVVFVWFDFFNLTE